LTQHKGKDSLPHYRIFKKVIDVLISYSHKIFYQGWALKENEKISQHEPVKRMSDKMKSLLETIFHIGTVNL